MTASELFLTTLIKKELTDAFQSLPTQAMSLVKPLGSCLRTWKYEMPNFLSASLLKRSSQRSLGLTCSVFNLSVLACVVVPVDSSTTKPQPVLRIKIVSRDAFRF